MHELALAREIARIAEEELGQAGVAELRAVHVRVGALSCASAEALRFAFAATLPEVRLEISPEAGAAFCADCTKVVPIGIRGEPCPQCGGFNLRVVAGETLRVTGLELQDAPG